MKNFTVKLMSIEDVKRFVNIAISQPCDIDVVSGRYIVDAKSIMGLFSLDLSKPVNIQLHGTEEDADAFEELIKAFTA